MNIITHGLGGMMLITMGLGNSVSGGGVQVLEPTVTVEFKDITPSTAIIEKNAEVEMEDETKQIGFKKKSPVVRFK